MADKVHPNRKLHVSTDAATGVEAYCDYLVACAEESIAMRRAFYIALSGGSTPKAIYRLLAEARNRNRISWPYVHLFWSDERCVHPGSPDSNYRMAMEFFDKLPIPKSQIHRIEGEREPIVAADGYEELLQEVLPEGRFDLMMLGMGNDGHTASLFPYTAALKEKERLVAANWVEKLNAWRLTLTYRAINSARHIALAVFGKEKSHTLQEVFNGEYDPLRLPVQAVGSQGERVDWFVDEAAIEGSLKGQGG